jgi:hypothetical protein
MNYEIAAMKDADRLNFNALDIYKMYFGFLVCLRRRLQKIGKKLDDRSKIVYETITK